MFLGVDIDARKIKLKKINLKNKKSKEMRKVFLVLATVAFGDFVFYSV